MLTALVFLQKARILDHMVPNNSTDFPSNQGLLPSGYPVPGATQPCVHLKLGFWWHMMHLYSYTGTFYPSKESSRASYLTWRLYLNYLGTTGVTKVIYLYHHGYTICSQQLDNILDIMSVITC